MKTLVILLLFAAGVVLAQEQQKQTLEQRVIMLEKRIQQLDKTIQLYHEWDTARPSESMAKTWVRVRRALAACGCEIN